MPVTARSARPVEPRLPSKAKPGLRTVKRKVVDTKASELKRAIKAINEADKRDDWFDRLRYL
jgi:hypothetical protein